MIVLVRWIPFLLGLSFAVNAIRGRWAFSIHNPHPAPALIALDVLLALACFAWAWWLRQRRLAAQR